MLGDEFDASIELEGWCWRLQREWLVPAETDERRLVGELALISPLVARDGKTEHRFHAGRAHIRSLAQVDGSSDEEHAEDEIVFGMREGGLLYVEVERYDKLPILEVTLTLPAAEFERLWATSSLDSLALSLSGKLRGVGHRKPLLLSDERATSKLVSWHLRVHENVQTPPAWLHQSVADHVRSALASEHLGASGVFGNQIAHIIGEFADSLAVLPLSARSARVRAIRQLIQEVRPGFLRRVSPPGEPHGNLWDLPPDEFVVALAAVNESEAAKLKTQYDSLWRHFSVSKVVTQGEEKAGAGAQGFQPSAEVLEDAAAKLLSLRGAHSETLEWALVDALIYAECIAFAQTIVSGQTVLGMAVPGELKGIATPGVAWKAFARNTVKAAVRAGFEAVKVGLTFVVAVVLAQDNLQTAWVITTGVTAARWVRFGLRASVKTRGQVAHDLLAKMAAVQDLLKSPNFNARLVREQLTMVTAEGAVFSPWVFNVLDARIRRESEKEPLSSSGDVAT